MHRKLFRRAIVIALLGGFAAAASAQELRKIRVAYPSGGICCLALYGGIQWKIFEENGLHVEIVQIRSQIGNMAMMANEIQYFTGVGPASVTATLRGMQSRGVWFASDQLIYSLMARPEIPNLRDLRGKKIGITGLGGTSHVALQIALEAAGENPKNFVYVVLGAAQMLPALETGTVEAAMFSPPFDFYAKKKRFREVLDVGSKVKMPLGGLTTMVSTLRNRPDEVKRVLRSLQLAKQEVLRSKEKATALMLKYLQVDKEAAEDTYDALKKTVSGSGVPTHEGMDLIMKSLQAAGQFTDRKVAFDEIADDRIAREVAKELGYKVP
ncbi:MAG: ABC transporter substrate-binding protein [Deltaproteobacteria bacterium]|nr:ABC transporter substrate-binding protein [Deltaproteobacteria bacterium]